jgi:hypothetical protein
MEVCSNNGAFSKAYFVWTFPCAFG